MEEGRQRGEEERKGGKVEIVTQAEGHAHSAIQAV